MNKTSKGLNRYEIHLTDKLMEEIEGIAISDGAKVHHISKKPIIRDTVISLLELGIKAVFEGVELPKKPNTPNTDIDNRIDLTVLDSKIEDKLKPLYALISELSDKLNHITNTDINNNYTDNSINDTDNINRIELNDNVVGYVDAVSCAIVNNILSSVKEDTPEVDNTNDSTLLECDILPIETNSPQMIPNKELTANNDDISNSDSELTEDKTDNAVTVNEDTVNCGNEVKSFEEAVKEIKKLRSQEKTNGTIAKELTGKFYTKKGKTNWSGTQVSRIK